MGHPVVSTHFAAQWFGGEPVQRTTQKQATDQRPLVDEVLLVKRLRTGWFLDDFGGMGQNPIPLVNIKIAGKWMFIPLKMVCIGIDP